ncbi:MAG: tetratricopeptide repeat protein, partial [Pseudonocardia sp.]
MKSAGANCPSEGPLDLLPLALSRPKEAMEQARAVLAHAPQPWEASVARQTIGIVLREFGDIDKAIAELRIARRLARVARSVEREADVLATLGVALIFAGRTASGRAALDRAVADSTGRQHGRILFRRGAALLILGDHREAMRDINRAVAVLGEVNEPIWVARALTERAFTHLAVGSTRRAAADLVRAGELFAETGQELESADAVVHRGVLALRMGDLPAALTAFDGAAERFDKLGISDSDLSINRCAALLAAGLPGEAQQEADNAVTRLERVGGQPTKRAELLLTVATCALAAGRPGPARVHARQA